MSDTSTLATLPIHRRNKQERERDLSEEARLYARGVPVVKIADMVAAERYPGKRLSNYAVSEDIDIIRRMWLESALIQFNEAKSRELAKLDELERAYWEAWENSVREAKLQEEVTEEGDIPFMNGSVGKSKRHKVTSSIRPGEGNVFYLQGVERCIQKRCQILGLFTPEKHQVDWRVEARGLWSEEDIQNVRERAIGVFMDAIQKSKSDLSIDNDNIIEGEFQDD